MTVRQKSLTLRASLTLTRWMALSVWRQQSGALIAAVLAVAMGVALGLGIQLVNASALAEFDNALSEINGEAQFRLTGASSRMDDTVLAQVERDAAVTAASPVIEARLQVGKGGGSDTVRLSVIGLDALRAATVTPALLPQVITAGAGGSATALFSEQAIFLSSAARQQLDVGVDERLSVIVSGRPVAFTVAGDLPGVDDDLAMAVVDIATAQWRLGWADSLSRIDIRLEQGTDPDAFIEGVREATGESALRLDRPSADRQRMSNLSRAYRVNLSVLALVALLTGGFIVFATLQLAVLRLVPALALLGVLGAPSRFPSKLVVALALCVGTVGSIVGVGVGVALAWLLLGLLGGDLGGGFFAVSRPSLSIPAITLTGFFLLGIAAAIAGALAPALSLRSLRPAQAIRSGQVLRSPSSVSAGTMSLILASVGAALLLLPAIGGIPLAAYLAIACWLFAGVLLVSPLLGLLTRYLAQAAWLQRTPFVWLAGTRLASAHGSAFPAMAGVVASFSLVAAMVIMVFSFRVSVDEWLVDVLPADLYVRIPTTGVDGAFDAPTQQALRQLPDVASIDFLREVDLVVDPERSPVELLARPVDANDPGSSLPLTGAQISPDDLSGRCVSVYASEPASRIYGWAPGDRIELPIQSVAGADACFEVGAIWRDYARQQGAITIDRDDYIALTGDASVSSASMILTEGASVQRVADAVVGKLADRPGLEIRSAAEIRGISLRIFDRSFAVTYALEAIALMVSLFGVAMTYAGESMARLKEFGMLRHLGVTRREIIRLFAGESLFCIGLGVLWGSLLGVLISQVLIHRVNPQSFNWSMATHWPIGQLGGAALVMIGLGVVTAGLAARRSAGSAPIAAVRTDW